MRSIAYLILLLVLVCLGCGPQEGKHSSRYKQLLNTLSKDSSRSTILKAQMFLKDLSVPYQVRNEFLLALQEEVRIDETWLAPLLFMLQEHQGYSNVEDVLISLGKGVIPYLRRLLNNPDHLVRVKTLYVLFRLGPDAGAVLPELVQVLHDKEPVVCAMSVQAIKAIGKEGIRALCQVIASEKGQGREWATYGLIGIPVNADNCIIDALCISLGAPQADTQSYALRALLELPSTADIIKCAIGDVRRLSAESGNPEVRDLADKVLLHWNAA